MNYKKLIVRLFIFTFISVSFFAIAGQARAASQNVIGWAWSSNIGWIKFDSNTSNPVKFDNVTRALSGYAWSDHIGWISFNSGDVAGCPSSPCSPTVNASGEFIGWARALTAVPDTTDGWDGWIHLSWDTAGNNDVRYDDATGEITGFAWGSDVLGWIKFDASSLGVRICMVGDPDPLCTPPAGTPSCFISASAVGSNVTVNYNIQNDANQTYTLTRSPAFSSSNPSITPTSANYNSLYTDPSVPNGTHSYSLSRSGGASCNSNSVTTPNTPPVSSDFPLWFNNDPQQDLFEIKIKPNRTATLHWGTTGFGGDFDTGSCVGTVSDSNGPVSVDGWLTPWADNAPNEPPANSNKKTVRIIPNGIYTFRLNCTRDTGNPVSSNPAIIRVSDSTIEER